MKMMIAVYGKSPTEAVPRSFIAWKQWIGEKLGLPTHIEGTFVSPSKGVKNDNAYKYKRYHSQFDEEVKNENVKMLTLTSMSSKPKGYIAFEWDWTARLGITDNRHGPVAILGVDVGDYIPSNLEFIDQYVQLVTPLIDAKYGFVVVMPQTYMPAGYVIGLACKGAGEKFVYDANSWRRFARKECDQSIRNIFGYNILNSKHLDILVGGQRLEEWIQASSNRGKIKPLNDGLYLWTFQEEDCKNEFLLCDYGSVISVRETLSQYQIFPWQRLPGINN